jgi:hypothetical protein
MPAQRTADETIAAIKADSPKAIVVNATRIVARKATGSFMSPAQQWPRALRRDSMSSIPQSMPSKLSRKP